MAAGERAVTAAKSRPGPLAAELRVTIRRMARRLNSELISGELTAAQISVLSVVAAHGPITPTALATRERVRPPSMTRAVRALVDRGLLATTPHPDDGRQQLVAITDEGRVQLKAVRRGRDAWLARQLGALSKEDREAVARAVDVLKEMVA